VRRVADAKTDSHFEGVFDKATFCEKARQMIDSHDAGYYILSSANIDNFKYINGQYGVAVGDQVLCHIAQVFRRRMDEVGGICGRIVADDFVLLYPLSVVNTGASGKANETAVTPPYISQRLHIRVGRYVVASSAMTIEEMYSYAKIAGDAIRGLYDKHFEYYDDTLSAKLVHRQRIEAEMEKALTLGQFEPWLQPQYNHATGAMIGAEVLVRWNQNGTYVSPAEFIPVFEENGFIYRMDYAIWEQTCALLRRWIDEKKQPVPLSVNVSRKDILQERFVSDVIALTEKYAVPANLLRFEITESAFADFPKTIIDKVVQLSRCGFLFEIDDFGSGYSSLNALKDVPAAVLKLDMKFFENTKNQRRAGDIIESVVRMAKWLGMAVIAEGVEDKTQADYLKSIGCYYIQGYFYARPMSVSQFEQACFDCKKETELSRLHTLETFDSSEFWNPRSMDTLIFNSFVGGACVFEYYKGKTDVLRLNDRYIRELAGVVGRDKEASMVKISEFMNDADRDVLFGCIREAINNQEETTCEVRLSGNGHTEYLRVTVRMIARTDDRALCYSVITNITAQRLAQMNERNMARQLDLIMSNLHAGVTATLFRDRTDMQVIYINNGFYKIYGYTKEQFEAEVARINDLILPEDYDKAMTAVETVLREKRTITHEFRAKRRDGSVIWVRYINSLMSLDGIGDEVLIGIATDITEEKAKNQELEFLNASAHEILAQPNCERAIIGTLEKIRSYFAGKRAFVMEMQGDTACNTYEACVAGVNSVKESLQKVPMATLAPCLALLQEQRCLVFENEETLQRDNPPLFKLLQARGVHAAIMAALRVDGQLVGFVGVDNPTRYVGHLEHLAALGDYIAVLLTRRNLTDEINREKEKFLETAEGIPGGFVRLKRTADGVFSAEYISTGMQKMLGMDTEQIMAVYGKNILNGVHPADRDTAKESAKRMAKGESMSECYRILSGSGAYIPVRFSGKCTHGVHGETYFNLYYTDVSV
jgi:PAS domain S-box-containing protein